MTVLTGYDCHGYALHKVTILLLGLVHDPCHQYLAPHKLPPYAHSHDILITHMSYSSKLHTVFQRARWQQAVASPDVFCVQGVVAVAAPFLYTFDITSQTIKSSQRQVVQQTVMHTFTGDAMICHAQLA